MNKEGVFGTGGGMSVKLFRGSPRKGHSEKKSNLCGGGAGRRGMGGYQPVAKLTQASHSKKRNITVGEYSLF